MERLDSRGAAGSRKKKQGLGHTDSTDLTDDGDNVDGADIERMLGIAMGCMGMSRDDFGRCTPSEFYAAYEAWHEMREQADRGDWERARMLCLCTLQPYSKKQLRASDIMQFPWDEAEARASSSRSGEKDMSHEEIMERYREAKLRAGLE